jgi:hypothetical protein
MTPTAEQFSSQLVRRLENTTPSAPPPEERPEPAFLADGRHGLRLDTQGSATEAKHFLAHAIARHPTDLKSHVQRIVLHAESHDPAILGAICDLFLVLGDKGQPLRRRMLSLARPLLSGIDYHALLRLLEEVDSDHGFLDNLTTGAVLSHGITGVTRLIIKQTQQRDVLEDPLENARQQLEYGQTELAQETLEHALKDNPGRLALHLALLEIYRHTRNRQQIEQTWQALQGQENPAQAEWQRLRAQLDEKEAHTP